MRQYLYVILLLIVTNCKVLAQYNKTGTWSLLTIAMPGDSLHRWGGYTELEAHSNGPFLTQFQYYEVKAGLSFDINHAFVALLGINHNAAYDYNDLGKGPLVTENRIWEQLTISQYLYRIKWEHRYRMEQRWVNGRYRNRFDYRLNIFVPLNNKRITAKTWFVSAYDEIFLNNQEPNFERNRASAAIGYQFDRSWILQAGWLNQYNYIPGQNNDKNNMILILLYRINRKNGAHREHLPTTSG